MTSNRRFHKENMLVIQSSGDTTQFHGGGSVLRLAKRSLNRTSVEEKLEVHPAHTAPTQMHIGTADCRCLLTGATG